MNDAARTYYLAASDRLQEETAQLRALQDAAVAADAAGDAEASAKAREAIHAMFYNDYGMYLGSPEQRYCAAVLRGFEGIRVLEDAYGETIADAGPNWQSCEFVAETLASINNDIREAYERAAELYADYATD